MINLFHLSTNTTGGWVTFAYHLTRSLEAVGEEVRLFKVNNRLEWNERDFGYGLSYQNLDIDTARGIVKSSGGIIAAVDKRHVGTARLLRDVGAWTVVHDPTEFKNLPGVQEWERVVTIRPTVQKHLPKSVFIPHPYVRQPHENVSFQGRRSAISISRIDFDKRTDIILDANRYLRASGREAINIRGFENRIYTRFKIVAAYPEWEQSVNHYPRVADYAVKLCSGYRFMVDMSEIQGDGGGTQYTTLEGIDAGCIPVLNEAWGQGEMRDLENCVMVSNAHALAEVVSGEIDDEFAAELKSNGRELLKAHGPSTTGAAFKYIYHE